MCREKRNGLGDGTIAGCSGIWSRGLLQKEPARLRLLFCVNRRSQCRGRIEYIPQIGLPVARWRLDETASQGSAKRSGLVEGSHCPVLGQHSARHEIKDFQRMLLSSRPIGKHQRPIEVPISTTAAHVERMTDAELFCIAAGDRDNPDQRAPHRNCCCSIHASRLFGHVRY
jgi:hypothetical protein